MVAFVTKDWTTVEPVTDTEADAGVRLTQSLITD